MTIWKWVIHEPTSRFVYSVRGGGDPEPRYDDYSFFGDQCWTEGGRLATGYIIVTIEADEKADRRTERYDTSSPTLCRPATQEEIDEFDRASDIARNRCMPIYQTRVVAFLDVLGWGDLVDKTVAHPEELERLKAALGFLSMPVLGMTQAREFFGEQEAHRIQPRRRDPFFRHGGPIKTSDTPFWHGAAQRSAACLRQFAQRVWPLHERRYRRWKDLPRRQRRLRSCSKPSV